MDAVEGIVRKAPLRPGRGTALRVGVVHSFYSSRTPSGENVVVRSAVEALARAGIVVELFSQSTDERLSRPWYPVEAGVTVAAGWGRSPLAAIRAFDPDVVHVHNLFPNYGRRWVRRLRKPLVATLHNFRPLCAAGTLYRDGGLCHKCPQSSSLNAVRHGCFHGRLQSVPLAIATARPRRDPLLDRADRLIGLSPVAIEQYVRAGIDADKFVEVPNFLPERLDPGVGPGGPSWLFAGRLEPEKGIVRLLRNWDPSVPLRIVGTGSEEAEVRSLCRQRIEYLGYRDREVVLDLLRSSRGLVMPSLWYEGFPTVHFEALAAGCPVLAWSPSSSARFVSERGGGTAVHWGEDVRTVVAAASESFSQRRTEARACFDGNFAERPVVDRLIEVYADAITAFHASE